VALGAGQRAATAGEEDDLQREIDTQRGSVADLERLDELKATGDEIVQLRTGLDEAWSLRSKHEYDQVREVLDRTRKQADLIRAKITTSKLRAQANARELVSRLEGHPAVEEVRYPGFGAIVAVVVSGGALAADLLTHSTSLWVHSTSLGGVESQLERRRRWRTEAATIPEGLVRLSVGIEDVDDLWDDLTRALDTLA